MQSPPSLKSDQKKKTKKKNVTIQSRLSSASWLSIRSSSLYLAWNAISKKVEHISNDGECKFQNSKWLPPVSTGAILPPDIVRVIVQLLLLLASLLGHSNSLRSFCWPHWYCACGPATIYMENMRLSRNISHVIAFNREIYLFVINWIDDFWWQFIWLRLATIQGQPKRRLCLFDRFNLQYIGRHFNIL